MAESFTGIDADNRWMNERKEKEAEAFRKKLYSKSVEWSWN